MTSPFRTFPGRTACQFSEGASVRCNGVWHELHSDGRWQDYGYCCRNPLPLYARRDGWIANEVVDDVHGEGVEVLDPDGERLLFFPGRALGPSSLCVRPSNSIAGWLDGYITREVEGCEFCDAAELPEAPHGPTDADPWADNFDGHWSDHPSLHGQVGRCLYCRQVIARDHDDGVTVRYPHAAGCPNTPIPLGEAEARCTCGDPRGAAQFAEPLYRGVCSDCEHPHPCGCPTSQHRSVGRAAAPLGSPPGPPGWPPSDRPGPQLERVAGTVATPAEAVALGAPVARRLDRPTPQPGRWAGTCPELLSMLAAGTREGCPDDPGVEVIAAALDAAAAQLARLPALAADLAALHMWAERAIEDGADPFVPGRGDVVELLFHAWARLPAPVEAGS